MKVVVRLIFVVLVLCLAWAAFAALAPVAPRSELVMLKPGMGARKIAAELKQAGVIRSAPVFLLAYFAGGRQALKAGEYRFAQAASAREVLARIQRGDIYFHSVVIPEGYNMFDVAGALAEAGLATRDEVLNLVRTRTDLVSDLDPEARTLEGFLFPDTYRFTRTQSAQDLVGAMVKRFRQEAQSLGLSQDVHRIVTMASIVEKETAVAAERPVVASVFYNRLQANIGMATDPSVIYAALLAGRYRGTIYQSDLQFDSPYNTYRHAGLPPGPIANPGRAALLAAMQPAQTDFYYFVADNKGGHRFARSLQEHARNVASYRRGLAAAEGR